MKRVKVYFAKRHGCTRDQMSAIRKQLAAACRFVVRQGFDLPSLVFHIGRRDGHYGGRCRGYSHWLLHTHTGEKWALGRLIEIYKSHVHPPYDGQFLNTVFHEIAHALGVEGGGYHSDNPKRLCEADAQAWATAMWNEYRESRSSLIPGSSE